MEGRISDLPAIDYTQVEHTDLLLLQDLSVPFGEGLKSLTVGDLMNIFGNPHEVDAVFTLNAAVAYAAGDTLTDALELPGAGADGGRITVLDTVVLNDKDDQKQALDLVFLNANQTLGTKNDACAISDANADKIVGMVHVATTDYVDLGGASVVCLKNIGLEMKTATGETSLWVAGVSQGTGTYTANGLTGKFTFVRY